MKNLLIISFVFVYACGSTPKNPTIEREVPTSVERWVSGGTWGAKLDSDGEFLVRISTHESQKAGSRGHINTDLPTDGYRYLAVDARIGKTVGSDAEVYVAVSDKEDLSGRIQLQPLYRSGETFYVPLDGIERVKSLGFYLEKGISGAKTSRVEVRIGRVRLVTTKDAVPTADQDATDYLNRQIHEAKPGTVIDLEGRDFLLRGTINFRGVRDLTIRNATLYDDQNRIDNRGNRQDFLQLTDCSNITLENIHIWGYRDTRTLSVSATASEEPDFLGRIYTPEEGAHYRIDAAKEVTVLQGEQAIAKGSGTLRFQIPDPTQRISLKGRGTVRIYGRIMHQYENEFSSGLFIGAGAQNITVTGCSTETIGGDGFQIQPGAKRIVISQFSGRGAMRQGASVNGGEEIALRGVSVMNSGRSGLDIEPYGDNWSVNGLTIDDFTSTNARFEALIANNRSRISNVTIRGFKGLGEGSGWKGGFRGGSVEDIEVGSLEFTGYTTQLSQVMSHGYISLTGERSTIRDFIILRPTNTSSYILNVAESNKASNGILKMSDDYDLNLSGSQTTAAFAGDGSIENVRVEDFARFFPNQYTKEAVTAASTNIDAADRFAFTRERSALAPGTYYYRLGLVSEAGEFLQPEQKVVVASPNNALKIPLRKVADTTAGRIFTSFNLYRGRQPGRYDTVYRIRPKSSRAGLNNSPTLFDLGTTLLLEGGLTTDFRFFGYDTDGTYATFSAQAN